ncbi:MAG: cupredoxin domain-containing protein [Alphaproteobacteria bacterium]|nr:cupredoxin domain-containing protein [Alphaproteobacteria bacterium]
MIRPLAIAALSLTGALTYLAQADDVPAFEIVIKDHKFQPATLEVPANKKVKLIVKNQDLTPEEFESYELNREKVIVGNSQAIIFIGPLEPGTYPYFGEFNMATAQGKIVAK